MQKCAVSLNVVYSMSDVYGPVFCDTSVSFAKRNPIYHPSNWNVLDFSIELYGIVVSAWFILNRK